MRELLARAPDFPDAIIRLLPDLLQVPQRLALHVPARARIREAAAARQMQCIHHFAPDIQLQLSGGGIADAHRRRTLIAGKPRHFPFGQPSLAEDAVHDLQVLRRAGQRPVQPVAPGAGLLVVAATHERGQGERRIADPAVAVVPVARAAELFRQ